MKRTAESIIKEMESSGIMMRPKMTGPERLNGLLDYQGLVLREVFNDDHAETLRLRDVSAHFEEVAKSKGLEESEVITTAIEDLDAVAKEIAIAISGASGERQVAKSIQYARRNVITLPNVNLSDGEDKTELDQVVITSNGILILEVKNYKKDITISEAGQIYGPCNKNYSDKNLGEQMNIKRHLLRIKLEAALAEAAPELKVHIESRVVFSDPHINVTDLYKQEAYCFKTNLPHIIDSLTSDAYYTTDQMRAIAEMIKGFAEDDAAYDIEMDFNRIRQTFAEALVLIESDSVAPEKADEEHIESSSNNEHRATHVVEVKKANTKKYLLGAAVFTLAVGMTAALVRIRH